MKGRQVFLDTSNYLVLGKLASGICILRYLILELISTHNRISVQKKATLTLKDSISNSRLVFYNIKIKGTIKVGGKDVTTVKRLPS